jgi:hypothetical protein
MERRVTVGPMTLNARSSSSLLTNVTRQFPTSGRNVLYAVDRFKENLNNNNNKMLSNLCNDMRRLNVITVLAKQTSGIHRAQTT